MSTSKNETSDLLQGKTTPQKVAEKVRESLAANTLLTTEVIRENGWVHGSMKPIARRPGSRLLSLKS